MNTHPSVRVLPPPAAGLLSLIFPGLGQLCTGAVRKGLLISTSFLTLTALGLWRVSVLAHRETGWIDKLQKALSRQPGFMMLVILLFAAVWLTSIWDAYFLAQKRKKDRSAKGRNIIFALILTHFFVIGWQIAEIDLVKMVQKFPDTIPPLLKILMPWEAAIHRDRIEVDAKARILVDSEGEIPPVPEMIEGQPYIQVEPRTGKLSRMDSQGNIVEGTAVTIEGSGYAPLTEVQIFWNDAVGNAFRPRIDGTYAGTMTDAKGSFSYRMTMPYRLVPPSADGPQYHTVEGRQLQGMGSPKPSEPLVLTVQLIIETIFMGMMATLFGIIFSIPISFLAARNLMFGSLWSKILYYITRTILNIIRAIEPLIWALIAVVWVGLGPFAGILALTIHTIAALGKLYSEAIENIDPGQIEAVQATGATKLQTIIHAVIPQMIPPFVSFTIYRWDINVRMSTVIGMVGGGGIGFLLVQYIRLLDYRSAGIAVWFIAITVSILDYVSAEIRNKFI
ncbi:MAG: phosphonate ABC transporter, permease protein PhnE [Spirochaetales bacterium]|nr:phosphonate ABC transporter, permease protein PhnE [Spirochaetales bacterium]